MKKVSKALAKYIIENLTSYFPETKLIHASKIFDLHTFISTYLIDDPIYQIGNSELYDICDQYGEKKSFKNDYIGPIIDVDLVKENWPYFKLLLLHNFDKNTDDNESIWRQIYKIHYENYQAISDLAKIIGMIPSNSCSVERGNNNMITNVNYLK